MGHLRRMVCHPGNATVCILGSLSPTRALVLRKCHIWDLVTISSPIVWIYSQVADLGSACKLAPQSLGLPQTERLSMRVLKSILKLREVSPLAWELYTVSRKVQVTKHK